MGTHPEGYIRVPSPVGAPESTIVEPANGWPGGGLEVPIPGPVTVPPWATFELFPAP